MLDNNTETYNPFVQIAKSFEGLVKSDTYYKLRKQTTASKLICALIITIILNMIVFGLMAFKFSKNTIIDEMLDAVSDFSYDNGVLKVDEKYEHKTEDSYTYIDTDVSYFYYGTNNSDVSDAVDATSIIKNSGITSGQGLILSSSNLIMVNFVTGQVQTMKFSEFASILHIPSFSKATIQSGYKGFVLKWIVVIGVLYIPFQFAGLFITALFYSVLAMIGKSITKTEDDFNTIYWIAFYINIPFALVKTIIRSAVPFGVRMLNMFFFVLFIFIILRTLKEGDGNSHDDILVNM